jgi:O-antigen/teichoic acid export membrane protein
MLMKFRQNGYFNAAKNALSLILIQGVNLLTPLLTLPYVLRVIDTSGYGKIIFYQAVVQYFSIFIDFGFQLSATRRIAMIRDDHGELATYCSTIQSCRIALMMVCLMIAASIYFAVDGVQADGAIYGACLLTVLGTLLTPMWLFAGLERIAAAAIAVASAKICSIPLTFLFVHGPNDAWRFALINSLSVILGGIICLSLVLRWRLITTWVTPNPARMRTAFADGWHYFVTIAAATFYSATNPLLLGLVSSTTQVAYFGAADRVRTMSLAPLQPVSSAFYPVLSRLFTSDASAAFSLLRKLLWLIIGVMGLASLVLFVGAPMIVGILMGDKYLNAIPVLRVMSIIPLVIGINTIVGSMTMLAMGMKKEVSRIILACGAGNLVILALLGRSYGASGAAVALLLTETVVAIALTVTFYKRYRYERDFGVMECHVDI